MNETLSTRQLRLVGLLLVVVVCAAGYLMVVRKNDTSAPSTASTKSQVSSTPSSTTPTAPAPTKAHTHPASPPKPATKIATGGLPLAVAQALRKHSVVVVSLTVPNAGVDQLASAEAKAGAVASNAGFVRLDVFRQRQGVPMLRKLGVVDTPAVLVVKRPNLVYAHFQGFSDRSVVEQSVADARG
jgi:cytoskeletal protein RodZ